MNEYEIEEMIDSIDLKYQLCKATNFAGSSCGNGPGYSSDANATNATDAGGHRRLGGAGPVDPNATAADLTYFVSVQCSEADSASFKLLATKIKSHLVNNIQLHGELCPGNFIYHHWEHMHVGEERSVRFRITKHGGDGSVMVRTGAARPSMRGRSSSSRRTCSWTSTPSTRTSSTASRPTC